jgi:hypothetical protein
MEKSIETMLRSSEDFSRVSEGFEDVFSESFKNFWACEGTVKTQMGISNSNLDV